MSIKRILAAAAASVVTVSAMSAVAFAGITNASDANGNYMVDLIEEGYTVTDVYGLTVTISGDYADTGVGGGIGFNSASTGWAQHVWGNADAGKEITLTEDNKVTLLLDAPAFADSDANDPTNPYAQVWIAQWWGNDATVEKVEVLGAGGVVLTANNAAPDDTTPSESTPDDTTPSESTPDENKPEDTNKPNVDTGVEGVAAVIGVAAVAAGAMIVAKKRK